MTEVSHAHSICRVGGEVKREIETLEIFADRFDCRVVAVELQFSGELCLNGCFVRGRHMRGKHLHALCVEITAEPLEMTAEEHCVASETFLGEEDIRRDQG